MEKEIRIYIADSTDFYRNIDIDSDAEDIMDCAESIGTVYSLGEFIRQFNEGELTVNLNDSNIILKAYYFENGEFAGEVE